MSAPPFRLIDPPAPFSPIEDWRAFLLEMEAIRKPNDGQVLEAIRMARQMIDELERELK
jgi:hypothetical protein